MHRWLPRLRRPRNRGRPQRQGCRGRAAGSDGRHVSERTLADRLADLRARPAAPRAATAGRGDALARRFGARLELADGGAPVVEARPGALPPGGAGVLGSLPATAYLATATTGL